MESTENFSNSINPKQAEVDFGASSSGNQIQRKKGSSKFDLAQLKAITVCINRQNIENPSSEVIKRAIEDPSSITFKRRPGEGSKPLFDREEIILALENDKVSSEGADNSERLKKRRKRSKSRDRSPRRHSPPTSPDWKYRMMTTPMVPWGYALCPRATLQGMPPFRPPLRPMLVYNWAPQKPVATKAPNRNQDSTK